MFSIIFLYAEFKSEKRLKNKKLNELEIENITKLKHKYLDRCLVTISLILISLKELFILNSA